MQVELSFLPAAELDALTAKGAAGRDVVICMAAGKDAKTALDSLAGAKKIAWKHPTGEPVWAAAVTKHPDAAGFVRFAGGPTGHRLWSESKAGFTITTGRTHAEAFEWVVENRVKHTYPLTAVRMLAECGGIQEGLCIDIGCGTGNLDIEIAKRSKLKIIGLDIDPDMRPLFEKRVREAGLEKRLSFVVGDAQKMPFPDHCADAIISRGTLTFIPDIPRCLKEVHRVLKPAGVAFLGGRYVYTPQEYKITTEKLAELVRESGVPGAQVIDQRGQWVKIVGPQAPKAAAGSGLGPHMLADRFIADYAITEGKCLLICAGDGGLEQALQRGFAQATSLHMTALYPSEKVAAQAAERIRKAGLADRITCKVGTLAALPLPDASFDAIAGIGPVLIFQKDKAKAIREIRRVLRDGGAALVGGKYLGMPAHRKVSSQALRKIVAATGLPAVRVIDDMGQWLEVRKGISERTLRD
jgi:ubiquinone/menaquinone biosynthesis C-methylase UbiE